MMKARILIVADDAASRATLAKWLMNAGHAVELAESARRAREVIANQTVALAIVAPHGMGPAGADLVREIGAQVEHLLLIAEPALASAEEPVAAANCLSWPCSEPDLLERVRSELARPPIAAAPEAPQLLRFEGYTLDAAGRSCLDANGQEVTLTRAEFSLLLAFARHAGRVLSRDELTQVAAGRGAEPDDRSVDVLISRLRRKIEPDPKAPRFIVTVPGEGYKFTAKPQVVAAEPTIAVAVATQTQAPGDGAPPRAAERAAVNQRASRPVAARRVLVSAAVITLVAGLGWAVWSHRAALLQSTEATPIVAPDFRPSSTGSQAGDLAERHTAAFKRMVAVMQNDRFTWRTVERLAIQSGVDEAEAHEILAEHSDEVVLGKSHDGKLIARLAER